MARNTSSEPRPRSQLALVAGIVQLRPPEPPAAEHWPADTAEQRNTGGPLARNTTPTIGPWPGSGSCALGHNTGEPLLDRKIHDLIANVRSGPSRSRFNQRQLERRRADWSQSSWRKPSRSRLNQCQLERCKSDWCQLERCRFDGFLLAWR